MQKTDMKRFRIFVPLALLALSLIFFSGCQGRTAPDGGEEKTPGPTPPPAAETESAPEEVPSDVVTIVRGDESSKAVTDAAIALRKALEAANHIASNGKTYSTLWAWKFNSLLYEYKQSHPFAG